MKKRSKQVCQDLGEKESGWMRALQQIPLTGTLRWEGAQEGCFQEKLKLVYFPTRFVLKKNFIVSPFRRCQKVVKDVDRFKNVDIDFENKNLKKK